MPPARAVPTRDRSVLSARQSSHDGECSRQLNDGNAQTRAESRISESRPMQTPGIAPGPDFNGVSQATRSCA